MHWRLAGFGGLADAPENKCLTRMRRTIRIRVELRELIDLNAMFRKIGKYFVACGLGLATIGGVAVQSAHAQSVTGVVTNKTTGKPATGDDVVLLKLVQGMQEL